MTQARDGDATAERIQKVLSRAGVASRRHAETLIRAGRVEVNGEVVTELGTRVTADDELRVDGNLVDPEPDMHYVVVYKPPGMVTTLSDPEGRPTVTELVPSELGRLFPVGRLDWASEGLLLMTNDGELSHRLTHPKFGVERVYAVKLRGKVSPRAPAIAQMREGVPIGSRTVVRVERVQQLRGRGKHTWFELVLAEGKNREVRRICEALQLTVLRLKRVAYGALQLGSLKPGGHRVLTPHEVVQLKASVAGDPPRRGSRP